MKLRTSLLIPDCHRPYHSRRAYDVMLEAASHFGVDEVVILGDYADFYKVSRHGKDPRVTKTLQEEIESVNQGLDEIDELFPQAKKVYLEGNHEIRLSSFLSDKAPELFGITDCRELFRFHERPLWSYKDYGRNQSYKVLGSNLYARHTPLGANAKAVVARALSSVCYGHIHKIEEAFAVGLDGSTHVAFSPGWLGDHRLRVFDYMHLPPQWQWGFGLVSVEESSKSFHHSIIHIKENFSCVVNGKRFKA